MLRSMMSQNPALQAMLDANPHVRHVMNDPAVLRQTMVTNLRTPQTSPSLAYPILTLT